MTDVTSGAEFTPVFSGVHITRSLVLCVMFVDRYLSLCPLAIVLSVLLRFADSGYLFDIFKLFLIKTVIHTNLV